MIRVLHIIGVSNGWALENRAKALIKGMPEVDASCMCLKKVTPASVSGFDFLHLHGLQIVPLIRKVLQQDPVWGYEVISERSLKHLDSPNVQKLLPRAAVCWAKNPSLILAVEKMTPNVVYIPNGVDLDLFRPRIRVGWVGNNRDERSRKYKGVPLIKEAVRLLQERLKNLAEVLFVPPPAVYPQVVPQDKLADHYRSLDVLVCASKAEGCSNVVNEALACGLSVVSTPVGMAEELKEMGARIIIAKRTAVCLADGLYQASSRKLRRAKAMGALSWSGERVAGCYLASYKQALEKRKSLQ